MPVEGQRSGRSAAGNLQRSGRSAAGNLRNFRAMGDAKLHEVYAALSREGNDYMAWEIADDEMRVRGLYRHQYRFGNDWGAPVKREQTLTELLDEVLAPEPRVTDYTAPAEAYRRGREDGLAALEEEYTR